MKDIWRIKEEDKALLQSLMMLLLCTTCLCTRKFLLWTSINSCKKNFPSLIIQLEAKKAGKRETRIQDSNLKVLVFVVVMLSRSYLWMYFDSPLFHRWIITTFPSVGKERLVRLIPRGTPPSLVLVHIIIFFLSIFYFCCHRNIMFCWPGMCRAGWG